ncbi:hypothetical protein [Comamonas odontotermitis]|uniref:hypothetical protein n=1 Tax=Comamonas odontotermitis TaxID=379895 RepID=UPI001CC67100|nr:hypothetical protein [Comamonas odontotermitis]UBB19326.1 hypothetical protein LAD35_21975 [Comamonas odontotermitis]
MFDGSNKKFPPTSPTHGGNPIQYGSSTAQRLAKLPDSKERGSRGLFLVVATSWVADDFFRNFFWLSKPVLQYKASLIAAS